MGEVRVVGIRVEQPQNQPVLLLREASGDRYLPIWIGQSEAAAIALEQQGISVTEGAPFTWPNQVPDSADDRQRLGRCRGRQTAEP